MAAMDTMIFKKIELKNATIEQAVRLLTKESKKSDPEHQGIRFVVRAPSPRPPASITLDEENASLKAVLKQIQQQTGYGYTVRDGALDLWYDSGEGLTRRTFTVPNGFFEITPEQAPQSSTIARFLRPLERGVPALGRVVPPIGRAPRAIR